MRRRFSNPDHRAERDALLAWFNGLEHDKGGRARLRRAASPEEVAFEPAFHRLLAGLPSDFRVDIPLVRAKLAALAGLAARVREHVDGPSLARQMGTPGGRRDAAPPVGEHRFRRLLTTASLEDRYAQLARVLALLDHRVNLWSLADAVYCWDEDPDLRQQWAYEYYQAALPETEARRP